MTKETFKENSILHGITAPITRVHSLAESRAFQGIIRGSKRLQNGFPTELLQIVLPTSMASTPHYRVSAQVKRFSTIILGGVVFLTV